MSTPKDRAPEPLRPLRLGEVLDRAVALTVQGFVRLAFVYVVFAVPLAVIQYFAYRDVYHRISEIANAIALQAAGGRRLDPAALARTLSHASTSTGWASAAFALTFVIGPLAVAALIEAISAQYLGRRATFVSAYRVALRRWLPLLGVNVLYLAAGIALYVAVVLVTVVLVLGLAFVAQAAHAFGVALAAAVGFAFFLAAVAVGIVALLALQMSYFACVIEGAGVVGSFARGILRIFNRIGLRRAFLFGATYLAIVIGIALLGFAGEATLFALTRSQALSAAYSTVVRIAAVLFTTAFVAIFYFDLRVREEGYDLEVAARAVQARAPTR